MNPSLPNLNGDLLRLGGWTAIGAMLLKVGAGILAALVVLIVGRWLVRFILGRIFNPLIHREEENQSPRAARLYTLKTVIRSVLMYALYFVVAIMLLGAIGINTTSLFATASVAGVAIGFGSQKIVRDVVTGFLLLLEDQFAVGEVVNIGGNTGVVEETGMRITKLRDDTGRLIIISNGDINQVINYSKGNFMVGVDVTVAADADPDKLREAVKAAAETLQGNSSELKNVELKGVSAMTATTLTYRVEATAPPLARAASEAELRSALRHALEGQEIALA